MNTLILTNAPVPYRIDFFEELGKRTQLTVLFEQTAAEQTHRNPQWFSKINKSFRAVYLEGIKIGTKHLQIGVCKYLANASFNTILIMGYSLPTEMLAILYLHLKKKPFILCFDGTTPKRTSFFKRIIKRFFIKKASAYLSTGSFTDQYIVDMGGNPKTIYRVPFTTLHSEEIPKAIPNQETKAYYKKILGIMDKRVVLSVGQFIHRKGFDLLIEAASQLREGHEFYLIGDEPTEEYVTLKQRIGAENVHFVGFKDKDELSKYYMASDYFVLPTREDVWALVIPEAMAFGLPTITTDHCGAGLELIKPHYPSCIIPVDDSKAIINAISLLDNDSLLRNCISKNNYNCMKEYTLESMVDYYMRIFKMVEDNRNA